MSPVGYVHGQWRRSMEDKKRSKRKDCKKHGWEKGGGIRKRSHLVELSAEGRVSFFFLVIIRFYERVLGLHWLVELSSMGLLYFLTESEGDDEKERWVKPLLWIFVGGRGMCTALPFVA